MRSPRPGAAWGPVPQKTWATFPSQRAFGMDTRRPEKHNLVPVFSLFRAQKFFLLWTSFWKQFVHGRISPYGESSDVPM